MSGFFDAAFAPVNLPYTLLLCIAAAFWIAVLLGILDARLLDWDLGDEDAPEDLDAASAETGQRGMASALADFLHLDQAPVSVFVTLVVVVAWSISLLINYRIRNDSYGLTLALAVPIFMGSILLARLVMSVLAQMRGRRREVPLVGRLCDVASSEVNEREGECTLSGMSTRLALAARTRDGEVLRRGETAVIVEWLRAERLFIVTRHRGAK